MDDVCEVVVVGALAVVHAAEDGVGEVDAYLFWVVDQLRGATWIEDGLVLTSAYRRFETPLGVPLASGLEAMLLLIVRTLEMEEEGKIDRLKARRTNVALQFIDSAISVQTQGGGSDGHKSTFQCGADVTRR